jgi:phosphoribosylamine-glycine ligase
VCCGVVCAQPPYPSEKFDPKETEGEPISFDEGIRDQIHPCAVMLGTGPVMKDGKVVDAPEWQTTAPYVMVVTGLGGTVKAAQESAYAAVDEISFPDMMYRTDIGDKVIKYLPELHRFGFAKAMQCETVPAKSQGPKPPTPAPVSPIRGSMALAAR